MSAPPATARLTLPLHELRLWGPCQREYAIVAERYPDGIPLTVEALLSLAEADIHVYWGIGAFLGVSAPRAAGKRYREAAADAEAAYWATQDADWQRYQRERDWDGYVQGRRVAQTAYIQAAAPALTDLLAWLAAHPDTARAAGVEVQP